MTVCMGMVPACLPLYSRIYSALLEEITQGQDLGLLGLFRGLSLAGKERSEQAPPPHLLSTKSFSVKSSKAYFIIPFQGPFLSLLFPCLVFYLPQALYFWRLSSVLSLACLTLSPLQASLFPLYRAFLPSGPPLQAAGLRESEHDLADNNPRTPCCLPPVSVPIASLADSITFYSCVVCGWQTGCLSIVRVLVCDIPRFVCEGQRTALWS